MGAKAIGPEFHSLSFVRTSLAADRRVYLEATMLMRETGAITAAIPNSRPPGNGPREAEHIRPEYELVTDNSRTFALPYDFLTLSFEERCLS